MSFNTVSEKPGLFKDLNKRLNDLLTKEFPLENKVEWKGETADGVIVETNLVQKNNAVVGTFTPKYKYKEYGAEFLVELNTKKEAKAEVSVVDQITKGLKLILTGNSKGEELWATFGEEYKGEFGTLTASIDYGKESGSTIKASATIGKLKSGSEEKNEIGITYFHVVNKDLLIGTQVAFDSIVADAKPKLVFGTQYKLENDTVLKGKFDTNGELGLSFSQKFNKNAKLVLAGSVDTNNLHSKSSSKLGFTLSLNN